MRTHIATSKPAEGAWSLEGRPRAPWNYRLSRQQKLDRIQKPSDPDSAVRYHVRNNIEIWWWYKAYPSSGDPNFPKRLPKQGRLGQYLNGTDKCIKWVRFLATDTTTFSHQHKQCWNKSSKQHHADWWIAFCPRSVRNSAGSTRNLWWNR